MSLFNVYPRYDINPVKASGAYVYDEKGTAYLDFYGGHGVISIGHTHPHYVRAVQAQLEQIGFYSNSVKMPIQARLSEELHEQSGYKSHRLFLCNSGAEATENALKLASFHTGKTKIIAFRKAFHGRTAAALNVTDNPKISAPLNKGNFPVVWAAMNDQKAVLEALSVGDVCAVIVEGIQGVGGLDIPSEEFLKFLEQSCQAHGALLILDEIQSGYGRSGKFFAHQHSGIQADLITMAKGMGNGFPVGGVLISPKIEAAAGMLGTTFGGNHLACAAGLAVLEVIREENLLENATRMNQILVKALVDIPAVKQVKGRGLMLGVVLDFPIKSTRSRLLFEHQVFAGASADPNLLRILPPLNIGEQEVGIFVEALQRVLMS